MKWKERVASFAEGPGGGREVLRVAYPLILAQMSFTLQTFVDRLFLTWYSAEAVAGAVTGLFTIWALMALFIGTGEYLTTFIAQYYGAGPAASASGPRCGRASTSRWAPGSRGRAAPRWPRPCSRWPATIRGPGSTRSTYARILMLGGFPDHPDGHRSPPSSPGGADTTVVLGVNVAGHDRQRRARLPLDLRQRRLPARGVAGAAWSTVVSQVVGAPVYLALIFRPRVPGHYGTLAGWRFERRALLPPPPLRPAHGPAVLAGGPRLRPLHDDRGPHRHGRAGRERHRLQPEHDRLHADDRARHRRVVAGGTPPRGGRARGGGAHGALRLRDEPRLHVRLRPALRACGPGLLSLPTRRAPIRPVRGDGGIATVLLRFVALYSIFDMMNVIFAAGLQGRGRHPLSPRRSR